MKNNFKIMLLIFIASFNSNYSFAQQNSMPVADCSWYAILGNYISQPCGGTQLAFLKSKFQPTLNDTSIVEYVLSDTSEFWNLKLSVKNAKTSEDVECLGFEMVLIPFHQDPIIFSFSNSDFSNSNFLHNPHRNLKTGDRLYIRKIQFKDSDGIIKKTNGAILFVINL